MTDAYDYDMATDLWIIAAFAILWLTILLLAWGVNETRKRKQDR